MRAVDTNVLVRLVTRDDATQVAAARAFVAGGAWVSHLVLAEATWVLAANYGFGAPEIGAAVEMFLNHETVAIQDPDVVAAALALFRKESSPGFADCLVLETARKAGHLPLGTFDRKLSRLPGAQKL